ncbi:MAG: hypothetical protein P8080_00790 [Gammaproteobacteria bacterium]
MLKRFLPLLFVVFVTLATVVLFLAFRDPAGPGDDAENAGPEQGAIQRPGADAGQAVAGADGVPEYPVNSEEDYLLALHALGTSPEAIEAWARGRGFPPGTFTAASDIPLDQPYAEYDEATLRRLAGDGDVWAMQYLAAELGRTRPVEAIEWNLAAAVEGSVYAVREQGELYYDLDHALERGKTERWDEETLGAVKALAAAEGPLDTAGLAWLMAAEVEGRLPPGSLAVTRARFHDRSHAVDEACRRARGILADLAGRRAAANVTFTAAPPPFSVELPPEETAGYCPPDVLPRPDYSGCQTVRLVSGSGSVTAHRCPAGDPGAGGR